MGAKYQVYKDVAGKYRFRLRAENNKIVAVSEAYENHAGCLNGVKSVQKNCNSEIEDMTIESAQISNPKYQVFYDKKCGFRFHLNARNGEIIAKSEGYKTKQGCMMGIRAVQASCDAEIEDLTAAKTAVSAEPVKEKMTDVAEKSMVGVIDTNILLDKLPESANKGDKLSLKGKLVRSDTGQGIGEAVVKIYEHDRSFAFDEFLAEGETKDDGSFNIDWKVRKTDWWDNTAEIFAEFNGNERAKPSRSEIQSLVVK